MSYIAGCRINLGEKVGIKQRGDTVTKAELNAAGQDAEHVKNLERCGALMTKEEYEEEA